MAATAPTVTKAVENHNSPIKSHTGRGLRIAIAARSSACGLLQASSAGWARRKAADARSIAARSRAN